MTPTTVIGQQGEFYLTGYGKGCAPDDRITKLIRLASMLRAEKILDIGCGDGSLTLALKHALGATHAFGVEISPQGAQLARNKGIVCHVLNVDESPLPFGDDSLDAIYAGEIIEHLYDPDKLLDEIHRVLHPDGFAIIDTPNLGWWVDRLSLLLGYQPLSTESSLRFGSAGKLFGSATPGGGGHLRILTLRAFKSLLENHGFKIRKVIGTAGARRSRLPSPLGYLYRTVNGILCRFPSLAVCSMCLVVKNGSRSGPLRAGDKGSRGSGGKTGPVTGERFIPDTPGSTASSFDYRLHHARYELAARHVRGRVLDIACGTGYGSRLLHEHDCTLVVGVDVDPAAVSYAESHYAPGPLFVVADAQRLPFPNGGFSGVVSFETIEHLADPDAFLWELNRVTAPGATLILSTPNYSGGRYSTPFHVREFRHDEFEKLLMRVFGSDIQWMGQLDARKKKDLPQSILRRLVGVVEFVDALNIRRFIPGRLRGPVTVYSLGIDSAPDEIFSWRPTALYQIALVKKPG